MTRKVRVNESQTINQGNVSITVAAEPLEIEVDPVELGRGPANAIARSVSQGIRDVDIQASPGTVRRRRAHGIASTQKWNATGKLAASIRAERDGQGYAIVAAPDRLQDPAIAEQIVADVRAIADPMTPEVERAIEDTATTMFTKRR